MGIEGGVMHFTDSAEIKHFAEVKVSKNDNVYGVGWANLVKDYLKTAYKGGDADTEIVSWGVTYKVLRRENVTVFYDVDGNTLFDVENKRLEREYEWVMGSGTSEETSEAGEAPPMQRTEEGESGSLSDMAGDDGEKEPEPVVPATVESGAADMQDGRAVKRQAEEKLKKDMEAAKDKSFAEPVIGYLRERCKEDKGLAEDVVQGHKTWQRCFDYIYEQAKKQSEGNYAAVRDEIVYEWAEDYYHKDDKAEEAEKARKEAERKERQKKDAAERAAKAKKKPSKTVTVPEKKADAPKEQPKPKKNNKDMDGQLDMFSMMGIKEGMG